MMFCKKHKWSMKVLFLTVMAVGVCAALPYISSIIAYCPVFVW